VSDDEMPSPRGLKVFNHDEFVKLNEVAHDLSKLACHISVRDLVVFLNMIDDDTVYMVDMVKRDR